jgi:hypothetical protein
MTTKTHRTILIPLHRLFVAVASFGYLSHAAELHDTMPDTWAATDALGRVLPMSAEVGAPKPNRTVGIFYFNWHAAFGNKEVHDIAKILSANPAAPPWGPVQAPHYWSEPRFGYDLPPLNVATFRERISAGANQGRARDATREEVHCGADHREAP